MSSKPRHGEEVAKTDTGQAVRLNRQMQAFIDELESQVNLLKKEVDELKNATP